MFGSNNNNDLQFGIIWNYEAIRVIRKVTKTQHQNPEFGHTQGEIKKNTCKKVH
jgi:hypothetical protein